MISLIRDAELTKNLIGDWLGLMESMLPEIGQIQLPFLPVQHEEDEEVKREARDIWTTIKSLFISFFSNIKDTFFGGAEISRYNNISGQLMICKASLDMKKNLLSQTERNLLNFFASVFELLKIGKFMTEDENMPAFPNPQEIIKFLKKGIDKIKQLQNLVTGMRGVLKDDIQAITIKHAREELQQVEILKYADKFKNFAKGLFHFFPKQDQKCAFLKFLQESALSSDLISQLVRAAQYNFTDEELANIASFRIMSHCEDPASYEDILRGLGVTEAGIEAIKNVIAARGEAMREALYLREQQPPIQENQENALEAEDQQAGQQVQL
ncbi:hypothetical protein FGO68_gene7237 [Halteria grandinella]|uniref:Uncharacterized protein n=1 Tax=Halteria grandinella TaxID=5974 RepID=A0A8J8T1M7_HALGN|nr:hypothetical protein FGO68_gene7237 [Halteria grandinella]